MRRQTSIEQLVAVLREFRAAKFCVHEAVLAIAQGNAMLIPKDSGFRPRDIKACEERLEATYILRTVCSF